MSEIDVEGGEQLILCQIGTSFDQKQDVLRPRVDDTNLVIHKSYSKLELNLTFYEPPEQTVEWSVEFWFKYALDEMNTFNFPYDLNFAGHAPASTDPCIDDYSARFQLLLEPDTSPIYNG